MKKKSKKTFTLISIIVMGLVFGFIALEKGADLLNGIGLYIIILVIVFAGVALYNVLKKDKELDEGQPADDEFSQLIKYKSGYYAYMASMYMWLFIFFFKEYFPDVETMLGGGILLSVLISFIAKYIVKEKINE